MFSYIIYITVFLIALCKLTCGWCKSKVCLVGKTAIITGGNSGIGYQVALSLASRGCRVILADIEDAALSRDNIIKETHNPNISSKKLDLSSLESVRKFAKEIINTESKLHILINNAGIGTSKIKYTDDGLDKTMQVNYFGHFLLTHLLKDLMIKSAPSRIIFTSSIGAFATKLNLRDLNPPENIDKIGRIYLNSKLCQIIAANCFADKLRGTGVTSNSLHPGSVRSRIFWNAYKEEHSLIPLFLGLFTLLFGKNTEEGAQTILYLACDENVRNVTGKFFVDCCTFVQPFQAYDKVFIKNVWDKSKEYVKLEPDERSNSI